MRNLLLLFLIFIISCQRPGGVKGEMVNVQPDTVYLPADPLPAIHDTIYYDLSRCDSVERLNVDLKFELFLLRYKLERVKYYLAICMRNPSQDRFLKGWIRRAVE